MLCSKIQWLQVMWVGGVKVDKGYKVKKLQ